MNSTGDILAAAAIQLSDPNMQTFTHDILLGWSNKGQREIARRTHCLKVETADIASKLTASAVKQSLNNLVYSSTAGDIDILGIFEIYCGSATSKTLKSLTPTTMAMLNRDKFTWRNMTAGTPLQFAVAPDYSIYLTPPPSAAFIAANEFYMIYSRLPAAELTDDDDVPEINIKAWDALVDYDVIKGKAEDKEFVSWDRLFLLWKDSLKYIKSEPQVIVRGKTINIIPDPDAIALRDA